MIFLVVQGTCIPVEGSSGGINAIVGKVLNSGIKYDQFQPFIHTYYYFEVL